MNDTTLNKGRYVNIRKLLISILFHFIKLNLTRYRFTESIVLPNYYCAATDHTTTWAGTVTAIHAQLIAVAFRSACEQFHFKWNTYDQIFPLILFLYFHQNLCLSILRTKVKSQLTGQLRDRRPHCTLRSSAAICCGTELAQRKLILKWGYIGFADC